MARSNPKARLRLSKYLDRKSTRLNSSHSQISYAVFCLKKKIKRRHASKEYASSYIRYQETASGKKLNENNKYETRHSVTIHVVRDDQSIHYNRYLVNNV